MVRSTMRLAAVLALWLAVPAIAAAQVADAPADDDAYRAVVDEAVREFSAGRWEEARALFARAHERLPNARTLRGLGMAAFEMRMYVQAIRELEAALGDPRKPLDGELAAQVRELVTKARAFVGRVKPVVEPAEAKLLIDGRDPVLDADGSVLLDAGMHVLSATLDGYKSSNMRLRVEGGSDQIVRVPLEPLLSTTPAVPAGDPGAQARPEPQAGSEPELALQPASSRAPGAGAEQGGQMNTSAWLALVGAAGFGATAGVLYFAVGDSQYRELESLCGAAGCSDRQISDSGVETTDTLTNVFLGLALVSGLTSGVLFAIDAVDSGEHDPLALDAGPGAIRLTGRF